IEESFATGLLSVAAESLGGLVGHDYGFTANSYAMVQLSNGGWGDEPTTGGAMGTSKGKIMAIYTAGGTEGYAGFPTGGLVGVDSGAAVGGAYWDLDTSGIEDPHQGAG